MVDLLVSGDDLAQWETSSVSDAATYRRSGRTARAQSQRPRSDDSHSQLRGRFRLTDGRIGHGPSAPNQVLTVLLLTPHVEAAHPAVLQDAEIDEITTEP